MAQPSASESPVQANSFERQLLPLDQLSLDLPPLAEVIRQAPLPPLQRLRHEPLGGSCQAFHLTSQSVHLVALRGPAMTATLASRPWLSLLYVGNPEKRIARQLASSPRQGR